MVVRFTLPKRLSSSVQYLIRTLGGNALDPLLQFRAGNARADKHMHMVHHNDESSEFAQVAFTPRLQDDVRDGCCYPRVFQPSGPVCRGIKAAVPVDERPSCGSTFRDFRDGHAWRQRALQSPGNKHPGIFRLRMRQFASIVKHLRQAKACRYVLLFAFLNSLRLFAVDGTVLNATTNKPQPNVPVALVQPSQTGMQMLASTTSDAAGKFGFDKTVQGPQLVQAQYKGVTYNKIVMPGAPASNLELNVYESTNKPGTAEISQHMILVQPSPENVSVSESFLLQDNSKYTYNDPVNGTLQFYLPPEANGQVRVTINAPGGMPIQRPAEKTGQKNVYKVNYAIKPGETRIDLTYTVPIASPMVLAGKVLHKEGKARLVSPQGVTLSGENIKSIGQEPTTQANIYDIDGTTYKVEIQGTGTLQSPDQTPSEEDSGQPQIQQIQPRIYDHIYWIVTLAFAILALGSYLLARNPAPK